MVKIAHVSDIHIRNFKYHDVYENVFNQLYDKLRELKPDIIVNTGDTAHTKLQLSPAYFDMTARFFTNLADIAPLHIIIGNHDLNLKNLANIDAITPIVEALKNKNIFFHKNSTVFNVEDINFHVLSMVDPDAWNTDVDPKKTNIALYHGSVAGVKTDMGWTMDHGEIEYEVLEKFDYALLGDIHKTNQALDYEGRCRYAGSLVQQNHGETNDKGFLFWEIEDKETFSVKHVRLTNPKPFISVTLTDDGKIPDNTDIPSGCRLRLISTTNHPAEIIKKAADVAKTIYKPESISFLNKSINASVGNNDKLLIKENLRDIKVQETLINEYLKDYSVSDSVLQEVFTLNRKYNTVVSETEDIARNINWKLKHLEWDNLFNYGEGNKIDFNGLSGVVGIFGKNYSGKSSIVDAALYTIFNTTSKNERKTTNVINQAKQSGRGQVVLEIDGFDYTITRNAEKYMKKLKGEVTEEAKTTLDLSCFDTISCQQERSLNELSRTDTDKYIRKLFGTIDDFMLTSLSSQLDATAFIREGSTRRKEILAKFLDLEIFDEKFKLAKNDSAELKGMLKRFEGVDYGNDIQQLEEKLNDSNIKLAQVEETKKIVLEQKDYYKTLLNEVLNTLKSHGTSSIDIQNINDQYNILLSRYTDKLTEQTSIDTETIEKETTIKKIDAFISDFDVDDLKKKKDLIAEKQKKLVRLANDLQINKRDLNALQEKIKLLGEVPCGTQFASCKFIKDAITANEKVPNQREKVDSLSTEHSNLTAEIEAFDADNVTDQLSKYDKIVAKKATLENEVLKLNLKSETIKGELEKIKNTVANLESQIEEHKKNEELFNKISEHQTTRDQYIARIEGLDKKVAELDSEIKSHYQTIGSCEARIEQAKNQQEELNKLRDQFAAYDYYMRCMHPNGISYDIIKKKLPIINDEIAKNLANIVDFEIFFEDDGNKLNILIKHPRFDPRPIEMGSGAEKSIASMAIRLALLQVSNLPKSNIFILDEPATALDAENMEGFIRMIDMIKSNYDIVLLISHLDALKDIVDTTITIDKENGYSYVNV
jgi:DNA repair exonuclease SbcCD ATPase subunit/DNA repair exonuclease SbcCD nuclease subunit